MIVGVWWKPKCWIALKIQTLWLFPSKRGSSNLTPLDINPLSSERTMRDSCIVSVWEGARWCLIRVLVISCSWSNLFSESCLESVDVHPTTSGLLPVALLCLQCRCPCSFYHFEKITSLIPLLRTFVLREQSKKYKHENTRKPRMEFFYEFFKRPVLFPTCELHKTSCCIYLQRTPKMSNSINAKRLICLLTLCTLNDTFH